MKKIVSLFIIELVILSGRAVAISFVVYKKQEQPIMVSTYDMVIIAPEQFSAALSQLIDHKNLYGIQTFLETTKAIYVTYSGRDEAEAVKLFIKDAVEQLNVSYVLLVVGRKYQFDQWHVPVRYVHLDDGFVYPKYLSDLYFEDLYTNGVEFEGGDSNKADVFAEWG